MDFYWLKYLIPVLAAAFVLYTAWRWLPIFSDAGPIEGEMLPQRTPFTFSQDRQVLTRRDITVMLIITVAYAVIAFVGLGSTKAPQSRYEFAKDGGSIDIKLPADFELGSLAFFSGLYTGEYTVSLSDDSENFTEVGKIKQGYADLFKWDYAEFNEGASLKASYLRISTDRQLSLAELAIYDTDGALLDSDKIAFEAAAAPLFDEQSLIPAKFSFLNSTYFDEIYHARTALEHIDNVWPYEITHPPLGKIIIGIGVRLFGMTPFGWRFSGTVCGILMLPILYIFLKSMFGGTAIPGCGTLIFAFDFMHFVQTRIATIDSYSVFFILLMYLFMWLYVSGGRLRYLALSGLFFGLGAASKWTCIYAGGGLAVIWLLHWFSKRHEEKVFRSFLLNSLFCVVFFVLVPCIVYYLSYIPYGHASGLSGPGIVFTKSYVDIVIKNQVSMWNYHSDLVATHPYSSSWYEWIVNARPILYYMDTSDPVYKSAFGAFLNPIFCWGGLFAIIGCGVLAAKDRSGKSIFILVGYLAQMLPWVLVSRITFAYHYFPSSVFLVLALCLMFDEMRRFEVENFKKTLYSFTALCVALFFVFYPVLSGAAAPLWYSTYLLKWFPSWPF